EVLLLVGRHPRSLGTPRLAGGMDAGGLATAHKGNDCKPPMAEVDEMFRGLITPRACVDANRTRIRSWVEIDQGEWQAPQPNRLDLLKVLDSPEDESIHESVLDAAMAILFRNDDEVRPDLIALLPHT